MLNHKLMMLDDDDDDKMIFGIFWLSTMVGLESLLGRVKTGNEVVIRVIKRRLQTFFFFGIFSLTVVVVYYYSTLGLFFFFQFLFLFCFSCFLVCVNTILSLTYLDAHIFRSTRAVHITYF